MVKNDIFKIQPFEIICQNKPFESKKLVVFN